MQSIKLVSSFVNETALQIRQFLKPAKYKQHTGTVNDICKQIVAERFNGNYFEAGELSLKQAWIRDTAFCLEGILAAGFKTEIARTLSWMLNKYQAAGEVTTTIFPNGSCFNVYEFGADSLPLLLYCLVKANSHDLLNLHHDFLQTEIDKYFARVFDPQTQLVKKEVFSVPQDMTRRKGTCVANAFMIMLKNIIAETDLRNPFKDIDLVKPFINFYWNGDYFINDSDVGGGFISADANLLPYWTGAITDKEMLQSSLKTIKQQKLDQPFPLKYHTFNADRWAHPLSRLLLPNYQGDTIWTFFAPIYIQFEKEFYPEAAAAHLETYKALVFKYGTFVELFAPDGSKPFVGRFGRKADKGMLWAAQLLTSSID